MRRTALLTLAAAALVAGPQAALAVDGLFIRGGAAIALVETIDGVVIDQSDAAELDQDFENGVAIDLALGYRIGRYALALQGGYARNGLSRSSAVFQSDGSVNVVDQGGTFQRLNLGLLLDADVARIPIRAAGVSLRPFVSAGIGVQWARFRYDERTNSAGRTFDGRFEPSLEVVGATGAGVGVTLRNGWDVDFRYTASLISDARFEGEGTQTGTTIGFAQLQQTIGVGLTVPLATLIGDRRAGRAPRNPEIDPLRR